MSKEKETCGECLELSKNEAAILRAEICRLLEEIREKIESMSKLTQEREYAERANLARDIALLWRRAVALEEMFNYGYDELPF